MENLKKCYGGACPLKNNCRRFNTPPGTFQEWFYRPPYDWRADKCEEFRPVLTFSKTTTSGETKIIRGPLFDVTAKTKKDTRIDKTCEYCGCSFLGEPSDENICSACSTGYGSVAGEGG